MHDNRELHAARPTVAPTADRGRPLDAGRGSQLLWPVLGGLTAGAVAGLLGVGGGVLLVPLLVLVLHRDQHTAHATSLVAVTLGAAAAAVRFGVDGAISAPGALALGLGAIVGARLGTVVLPRVSPEVLRRGFAIVMVVVAVRFLVAAGDGTAGLADSVPDLDAPLLVLHVAVGLLAGLTSSVLGVGGGVVNVPALTLLLGYGQHVAEGTSLAVIVPTALVGAIGHARNGYTDWRLGATLGVAALVGGLAGATVALGLDATTLTRLFGVLLLAVAAALTLSPRMRGLSEGRGGGGTGQR